MRLEVVFSWTLANRDHGNCPNHTVASEGEDRECDRMVDKGVRKSGKEKERVLEQK